MGLQEGLQLEVKAASQAIHQVSPLIDAHPDLSLGWWFCCSLADDLFVCARSDGDRGKPRDSCTRSARLRTSGLRRVRPLQSGALPRFSLTFCLCCHRVLTLGCPMCRNGYTEGSETAPEAETVETMMANGFLPVAEGQLVMVIDDSA